MLALDIQHQIQSPTAIHCDSPWPYPAFNGYALIPQHEVHLRPEVCQDVRSPVRIEFRYATSMLTLIHELAHVGWENRDEAATDCFALFSYRYVLRHRFGATKQQAQSLYNLAWGAHQAKPQEYKAPYCTYLVRDPLS